MMPVLSSCLKINLYHSTVFFYKLAGERLDFQTSVQEGGVADLANFWCLARFEGSHHFSLWFSVFVNNDDSFRIFLSRAFYGFSGFAKKVKEVTPRSRAKTGVIPRDLLYSVLPFIKWNG